MSGEAEALLASMLTGGPSDVSAVRKAARAAGIKMADVWAAAMSLDVRIDGDQWTLPGHEADDAQDAPETPPASDDTREAPEGRESGAVDREGMLCAPGLELAAGERQAQCHRCGLSVVTATPPDTLPRCQKCRTIPPPRMKPEAPWITDDDDRDPVQRWSEDGPDALDDWRTGRGERDRHVLSRHEPQVRRR